MIKLNLLFPLGALAALAFGNAVAQPAPVATEKTHTISATVEKIDAKQRLIELRKGEETQTIQVPSEVRNFDKIKVGDEVVVTYYEGLAAEFKKKGESKTIGVLDTSTGTARMPEGSGRPGAAVANKVKTTVVIEDSRYQHELGDLHWTVGPVAHGRRGRSESAEVHRRVEEGR